MIDFPHGLDSLAQPMKPKEDAGCVLAVAEWMNKRFESRGLGVTLKP